MEKFARDRELAPDRAERTDTLVWGKNAVTELLKSGGAVDTVYLTDTMPQAVAGYLKIAQGAPILKAFMANRYADGRVLHVGRLYCPDYMGLKFTIGGK